MRKCRPLWYRGPGEGQEQDIPEIGTARSAQVRMRKPKDSVVRVVIAAATASVIGVGAQLNHAEGHRGAREGVPGGISTDHRVNQTDDIMVFLLAT